MSARNDRHNDGLTQPERFAQLARELGADEDEARWDERLKKVVEQKPEGNAERPE